MTAALTCPHCSAGNPAGGAFCESCGKALPASTSGPRVLTGNALPSSQAGQRLVGDELRKLTKRAANTLLILGILMSIVGGGIFAFALTSSSAAPAAPLIGAINVTIGLLFIGLYFWARRSPLPAAIVGLVLYSTIVLLNIVLWFQSAGSDGHPVGSPVGILQIVIIGILVQGIQAGVKHRQLLRSSVA